MTPRVLLILLIALFLGVAAGTVAGLASASQAIPAFGMAPGVILAILAGLVTFALTALAAAHRLHRLLS